MDELTQNAKYGDTSKVQANLRATYEFVLEIVGDSRREIRPLRSAFFDAPADRQAAALRSTVFRALANEWLRDLSKSTDAPPDSSATNLLRASLETVTHGRPEDLPHGLTSFEAMRPPSGDALRGMWTAEMKPDLEAAAEQRIELAEDPDVSVNDAIGKAIQGIAAIDPDLCNSIMPHVDVACRIVRAPSEERDKPMMESSSHYALPGAIFLADHAAARGQATCMEAVLHESTHQKYFDIVATYQVFRDGYSPTTSAQVTVPWNAHRGQILREWAADRVLIALHVYVHLARLFAASAAANPASADEATAAARRCLERSIWLSDAARGPLDDEYTHEGHLFRDWTLDRVNEAWLESNDALPDISRLSRELLTVR